MLDSGGGPCLLEAIKIQLSEKSKMNLEWMLEGQGIFLVLQKVKIYCFSTRTSRFL